MLTPNQRQHARYILKQYLLLSEGNRSHIHYSQARPITSLGDPPGVGYTTDCSGYVISGYRWMDIWCSFPILDPGGLHWSGYGWTGSILDTNKRRRVPLDHRMFIGDMALYGSSLGNTKHVTVCRSGGDRYDSIWSSLGGESGPVPTRLGYRSDLLLVVRSESLA